jgi:hypothetical protein
MPNCLKCQKKTCKNSGKPCADIERYLRRMGIYGRDWIRPQMSKNKRNDGDGRSREVPISMILSQEIDFSNSNILNDLGNCP